MRVGIAADEGGARDGPDGHREVDVGSLPPSTQRYTIASARGVAEKAGRLEQWRRLATLSRSLESLGLLRGNAAAMRNRLHQMCPLQNWRERKE